MNPKVYNKADSLAVAGMVCGIIGCVTMYVGVSAIFFGSLSLILGLLARGNTVRIMNRRTRAAVILGTIAILAGIAICARTTYVFFAEYGTIENAFNEFMKVYNESYQRMYDSLY